jgi:hypothetical protein
MGCILGQNFELSSYVLHNLTNLFCSQTLKIMNCPYLLLNSSSLIDFLVWVAVLYIEGEKLNDRFWFISLDPKEHDRWCDGRCGGKIWMERKFLALDLCDHFADECGISWNSSLFGFMVCDSKTNGCTATK